VLLSIVGLDHNQRAPHYAGKREQERLARRRRPVTPLVSHDSGHSPQ
jgi:hypothetical protein